MPINRVTVVCEREDRFAVSRRVLGKRYLLQSRIGEGGMANVYLAVDEKLGRKVAVKLLHEHMAQNTEIRQRFRQEARAVSGLDHPNIVKIYDFSGEHSKRLWIVTEVIEGANLAQFIRKYTAGWLHPIVALFMAREVCKALEAAHEKGIVHRDIKPENVMITGHGQVKLMDFGIAKDLRRNSMTQTGTFMGSPSYMSPEQIKGRGIDHRSDIYSCGVLLYELVTGRLPFTGSSTHDVVLKIVEGKYVAPKNISSDLSGPMNGLIVQAMSRDPDRRFQTIELFGREMDHYLASLGFVESHVELERFFSDRAAYEARLAHLPRRTQRMFQGPEFSRLTARLSARKSMMAKKTTVDRRRTMDRRRTERLTQRSMMNPDKTRFLPDPARAPTPAPPPQPPMPHPERGRGERSEKPRERPELGRVGFHAGHSGTISEQWLGQVFGTALVGLLGGLSIWGFVVFQERLKLTPVSVYVAQSEARVEKSPTQVPVRSRVTRTQRRPAPKTVRRPRTEVRTEVKRVPPQKQVVARRDQRPARPKAVPKKSPAKRPKATPKRIAMRRPEATVTKPAVAGGLPELLIRSQPAAEVYVDGTRRGTTIDNTNSSRWLTLKPGRHRIELRRRGYETYATELTLAKGDRRKLPIVSLQKAEKAREDDLHTLTLSVHPLPAKVEVKGKGSNVRRTIIVRVQPKVIQLPAGVYEVIVTHKSSVKTRTVRLPSGDGGITFTAEFESEEP